MSDSETEIIFSDDECCGGSHSPEDFEDGTILEDNESPEIVIEPDWEVVKGKINLGLVCINTILRKKEIFCSRTMIRKNFTVESAKEKAIKNILDIIPMIKWNVEHGIKCLRLSSDIFPHFTDEETESYSIDFAKDAFEKVAKVIKDSKMRILMHPAQFCQVGAASQKVFDKTVWDLGHHADILDALGVDNNGVLIVHGGGVYGDKEKTKLRWIKQFKNLPENVKKRLVIENCERSYNVRDCLDIAQACKIPVVFDCHHFDCYTLCHPNEAEHNIPDFMPEIIKTWGNRRILMHVSQQARHPDGRSMKLGKHSDYIDEMPYYMFNIVEDYNISYDLEVEAKMKEQAILRLYKLYPGIFTNKIELS